MSGYTTSAQDEVVADDPALPTLSSKTTVSARQQYWLLLALMFTMMLCGWTEGSVGPLLPSLQVFYGVNYETLSLIFLTGFLGSIISGLTNVFITDRVGFGLTALTGALCLALSYAMLSVRGSFGLFLLGYAVNGFGTSLQDAQVNNMASRLPSITSAVFQVQACFGLGATIAPFLSTLVVERFAGRPHLFFLVAMGVSCVNALILLVTFKGRTENQVLGVSQKGEQEPSRNVEADIGHLASEADALLPRKSKGKSAESSKKMKRIFVSRAVWAILGWDFFYCGAEVVVTSYLTSYLIAERGGTVSSGYATMGFWAALTLSRFLFGPLSLKLGYSNSMYIYTIISLAAQVAGAMTPSLIGYSIAYAVVGLMYGPLYPNALMIVSEHLDDDLRVGVIGLMGSVGGAGGAVMPLIVGAASDRWGVWTFAPLCAVMVALSLLCWMALPKHHRS